MKIKERWVAWEELLPGFTPATAVDFEQVGGLAPGSIPFGDATGFLTQANANLFYDKTNIRLGVGIGVPVCTGHFQAAVCPDYAGIGPDTILLLENDDNVALQLQCATNAEARIVFTDDDFNPPAGRIMYNFTGDYMEFTVGKDVLAKFEKDGADSRMFSYHKGITIDSTGYAAFIADSHNADAYFALEEDTALKWTMGFDFTDSLKFQISQGLPGTNVRFEIDAGTLINLYLDVGIRDSQDLRFYNNGNYVGFKPPALGADQIWTLPDADAPAANQCLQSDAAGNLDWSQAFGIGDSPTFVTVKLSDLTDGYIPYHVDDATGLADSPITVVADGIRINEPGAADYMDLLLDGSNAFIKWSDGNLTLRTDQGVNIHTYVHIQGKGTGRGFLRIFDGDDAEYLDVTMSLGHAYIRTLGTAPGKIELQYATAQDIRCWSSITSGNPYFYFHGWHATDTDWLRIRVEADGDALVEAENNLNILARGGAISFGDENLTTTGTLSAGASNFGDGGVTDYVEAKADGEIELHGTARVSKHIHLNNAAFTKGTTAPTQVILGNYNGWSFDIGDDSVMTAVVPDDWDPTTDLTIKVCWYIDEAYAADKEVQWRVDWSAMPEDFTEAVDAPTHSGQIDSGDIDIPAVAKRTGESTIGTIAAASLSATDCLGLTLSRIAVTNDDPTADPVALHLTLEYISNKLGV